MYYSYKFLVYGVSLFFRSSHIQSVVLSWPQNRVSGKEEFGKSGCIINCSRYGPGSWLKGGDEAEEKMVMMGMTTATMMTKKTSTKMTRMKTTKT